MDDFARIRQLHRDGLSARRIAKQLGVGRDTIRKALANAEPTPYTRTVPRTAPVFGPFAALVDAILEQDRTAPRKQRHTASQIFRRLVNEHHYTGGYDQVRRHLKSRRLAARETFVPLDHLPGHRCEADFGHIHVDFPAGRRLVPVLVVTWSYSNAPFAVALPTERTEAILHGMGEAFAFFGGVPAEVWWDNPTTVAIHIFRGRERTLHSRYAALASHFLFAPKFCLPRTPREKPRVENRVKDLQRLWATPVPRVASLDELNAHLRRCGVTARERTCGGNAETVAVRFARDQSAALPLPRHPFDACVIDSGAVDKYRTVAFDGNRSRVPRRWAFRPVTVKGFIDRIDLVADGRVVASHARCYGRHERVLDPLHFLAILQEKPATLDHAPVYRDWALPPVFAQLRTRLEADHGVRAGVRQYIRGLQLLARFPLAVVEAAVTAAVARGRPTAAAIAATAERLATATTTPTDTPTVRRTFGPRGKTPVLSAWDRRDRLSAISCVTLSPVAGRPGLYFDLLAHNVRGGDVVTFLKDLHRRLGPLTVGWDRSNIHSKSKVVKQWLAKHPDVTAESFPGYVPDLNPDEGVWGWAKYGRLANLAANDVDELWDRVIDELIEVKFRPDLLRGFIRQTGLPGVSRAG